MTLQVCLKLGGVDEAYLTETRISLGSDSPRSHSCLLKSNLYNIQ